MFVIGLKKQTGRVVRLQTHFLMGNTAAAPAAVDDVTMSDIIPPADASGASRNPDEELHRLRGELWQILRPRPAPFRVSVSGG